MERWPVLLYYKYVEIVEPDRFAAEHKSFCLELGLKGRVLIAAEGINGTVAGPEDSIRRYVEVVRTDARFQDMEFKVSDGDEATFPKLTVKTRPEIVTLQAERELKPDFDNHVTPAEWKRLLEEEPEAVVIDVRNRYESDVGRFENAVTCPIEHFRELPEYLAQLESYKHRPVLMYCTGGIRCEKASALFRSKGFRNVRQLHGGIMNYLKEFGNTHWLGECFVFDQRMTVKVEEDLRPAGRCAHTGRTTSRFVDCLHDPCHRLFLLAEGLEKENPDYRLCPDCLANGLTAETAHAPGQSWTETGLGTH